MANFIIEFIAGRKGNLYCDQSKCITCGKCENRCHHKAIQVDKSKQQWNWNYDKCVRCGHCLSVCPTGSLSIRKESR